MTVHTGKSRAETAADLGLERLLAELSARFVNLPAGRLNPEIETAQRQLCEALDVDRSVLYQVPPDNPSGLVVTHVYQRSEDPPVIRQAPRQVTATSGWALEGPAPVSAVIGGDVATLFPYLFERLRHGETVVIPRLGDLPPEAAHDREMLRRFGVASNLTFSLSAGGEMMGALSLAMLERERDWAPDLVERLHLVAGVLANALARKRADDALRMSEERLRIAATAADAGFWDLDVETGAIWATPGAKALYGFTADDDVDLSAVLQRVHPDDQPSVRARLAAALHQRAAYNAEYRVVLPDGQLRWLNARGSAVAIGSGGEPDRLMGVTVDVTERKRRDILLQESEARLSAAVDAAELGFYEAGQGFATIFLDDRMRTLLGIPADEEDHVKEFWIEHLHPDDRDRLVDLGRRLAVGELDRVMAEYRYEHPSGKQMWFSHASRAIERDVAGGVVRAVGVFQNVTARKEHEAELQRALEEVQRLRDQLHQENVYLRQESRARRGEGRIIGRSAAIRRVLEQAAQVAPTPATVLLTGETGTGKERVAELIHEISPRHARTMVRVNCAAIPAALIESELFGREKGAYTGALSRQIGRFELAHESTIFLDEIGDLPLEAQVKLLRVLQDRQIERLGSPRPVPVDVRIIAASNRDLEAAVRNGAFREDLYYRLAVFPITVPPLRDRLDDIPELVQAFVEEFAAAMGKRIDAVSRRSLDELAQYSWPGNVRELANTIERALILSPGPVLRIVVPSHAARAAAPNAPHSDTLRDVERNHLLKVLQDTGWRIRGHDGAAELLGMKPTTLETRMAKLGIRRPGRIQSTP